MVLLSVLCYTPDVHSSDLFGSQFNLQAHTLIFCAGALDSLEVELKGSKDFSKLYAGIAILGYIALVSDSISTRAFSQLLRFLGHRYPKVCGLAYFPGSIMPSSLKWIVVLFPN